MCRSCTPRCSAGASEAAGGSPGCRWLAQTMCRMHVSLQVPHLGEKLHLCRGSDSATAQGRCWPWRRARPTSRNQAGPGVLAVRFHAIPPTTEATRDGRTIVIRALQPEDKPLLVEGLERMSEQSRYRRFLAPKPSFTGAELAYPTEIDHNDHEALIAIEPGERRAGRCRPLCTARGRAGGRRGRACSGGRVAAPRRRHGPATHSDCPRQAGERAPLPRHRPERKPAHAQAPGPNGPSTRRTRDLGPRSSDGGVRPRPRSGWRQLLDALRAAARGDLTFRMPHMPGWSRRS